MEKEEGRSEMKYTTRGEKAWNRDANHNKGKWKTKKKRKRERESMVKDVEKEKKNRK